MSNFKNGAPSGIVLAPAQNQVIRFRDEAGTEIQISQQDVLAYICDKATPQEVVFFMELCRSQKLNPFKREAYLVKFGNSPAQMITAEIVFERRANAHPDYKGITQQQFANRMLLREIMLAHGFKPLAEEWWHFTLADEPYPETYFDFPVR